MSAQSTDANHDRAESRAEHLLPEELAAGSDDPYAQARAILADSERRETGRGVVPERRTSEETVTAPEPPD